MLKLALWLMKIFCRREYEVMILVYATLIIKGLKTINDVPTTIRAQVAQMLIDLDVPELAQ